MKRVFFFIFIGLLIFTIIPFTVSYGSPARTERILVPIEAEEVVDFSSENVLERYPEKLLIEVSGQKKDEITALGYRFETLKNNKYVGIKSHSFSTDKGPPELPQIPSVFGRAEKDDYYIIQFIGPIKGEWKEELREKGVIFHEFRHRFNFIAEMSAKTAKDIEGEYFVNWVGDYEPAYRFDNDLLQKSGDYLLNISLFEGADGVEIKNMLESLGGEIDFAGSGKIKVKIDIDEIKNLANLKGVKSISEAVSEYRTFNADATWITQSNIQNNRKVTEAGITGIGQLVTVMDSELYGGNSTYPDHEMWADPDGNPVGDNHRKIQEHYAPIEGCANLDIGGYHGTHVTGTVLGDSPLHESYGNNDGNALGARLIFQDVDYVDDSVLYCIPLDMYNLGWLNSYNSGSRTHTNSWGGESGYHDLAIDGDDFIWNNKDYNILFAMGNSGPGGNSLSQQAEGKNIISVGGVTNYPHQDTMYHYSSRGYASDGRIKPTLLHVAEGITSANRSEEGYSTMNGTSMAAPGIAGQVAQVRQYYEEGWHVDGNKNEADGFNPSNALVRATLINGAVEITGSGAYLNDNRFPNNDQGYGRSKLDRALHFEGDERNLMVYDSWTENINLNTGESWSKEFYVHDTTQEIEVTLAWSDYPGSDGSDEANPAIVNDLDLELTTPDGTRYVGNAFTGHNPGYSEPNPTTNPWSGLREGEFDGLNVEENILLIPGHNTIGEGTYELTVAGHSVSYGQPFAVVITGGVSSIENTGTIAGNVSDSENNPIEAAVVKTEVYGTIYSNTTDVNGDYTISDVPLGTHEVTASHDNYSSKTNTAPEIVNNGDTITQDFTLNALADVKITVQDTAGAAIETATVTLDSESKNVDTNGVATFQDVVEGSHQLEISAENYLDLTEESIEVKTGDAGSVVEKVYQLNALANISGVVKDYSETALEGADIEVDNISKATTDQDGNYLIFDLEEGSRSIKAVHDNYIDKTESIVIEAGDAGNEIIQNFTLEAEDGSISGTVYNYKGNEVTEGTITLTHPDNSIQTHDLSGAASYNFSTLTAEETEYSLEVTGVINHKVKNITVILNPGQSLNEDLNLKGEEGKLGGSVNDYEANPVDHGTATLYESGELETSIEVKNLSTDGNYLFEDLTAGETYWIEVTGIQNNLSANKYQLIEAGAIHDLDFNLELAEVEELEFFIAPATTTAGISEEFEIGRLDAEGSEITHSDLAVSLATSSEGPSEFRRMDGTVLDPAEIIIPEGESRVKFNYYDEKAGSHNLSVDSTKTDQKTTILNVEPAKAISIDLDPSESTIAVNSQESYTGFAYDDFNNQFNVTSEVTWDDDIEPENSSSWSENTITVQELGSWQITGQYENINNSILENTSTLNVVEEHSLQININGRGSVSPAEGTHTYLDGQEVEIIATPDDGWDFSEWTGKHSGTEREIKITMKENKEITANFEEIVTRSGGGGGGSRTSRHRITLDLNMGEAGSVRGGGLFNEGEEVQVEAITEEDYQFLRWEEDGGFVSGNQKYTFTLEENRNLLAIFSEKAAEVEKISKKEVSNLKEEVENIEEEIQDIKNRKDLFDTVFKVIKNEEQRQEVKNILSPVIQALESREEQLKEDLEKKREKMKRVSEIKDLQERVERVVRVKDLISTIIPTVDEGQKKILQEIIINMENLRSGFENRIRSLSF